MYEYYVLPSANFKRWGSPLKERYLKPPRSPADGGSEVILKIVYTGPLAMTSAEIDEIIDLGGVQMAHDELMVYKAEHPEKWQ